MRPSILTPADLVPVLLSAILVLLVFIVVLVVRWPERSDIDHPQPRSRKRDE